jgi:hypothetical protein
MKLVALAMALAALALTGSATAANRHVVETAVDGNVEADFSYDYNAQSYRFTNPHLTIRRGGAVLLDEDLKPVTSYSEVDPARYFNHQKSVAVRNLDVDPEPEIVLHLWWGGAHCCWYTQVYRFDQMANDYVLTRHIFGNADYRARDLDHDGRPEFVSGDDRFAYQFTDFADSSWPVQVWRYRAGRFDDVTRSFPTLARRDARRQWHWALARRYRTDNVGVLAAWTADECLLRHCDSAFRQLEVLRREHHLGLGWDKTAKAFLRHLHKFLRRTGYMSK